MKSLNKPDLKVSDIVAACVDNYRNPDLKNRFSNSLDMFSQSANEYDQLAKDGELYTLPVHDSFSNLSSKEMEKLYTDKFSKQGQGGRQYYDKLIAATTKCPYCIIREVNQLDHVLPKADYPAFAVLPYNMVPSCRDCNENKGTPKISQNGDLHLHPYYDMELEIEDYWLYANIVPGSEIQVMYTIEKPASWDTLFWERVIRHFSLFKLGKSYSFYASDYVVGEKKIWMQIKDDAGVDTLKQHLLDCNDNYKGSYGWNHWKTTLCFALANSDWFLNSYIV